MKVFGKVLLSIVEIIVIVFVVFITTCLLCRNKYGYTVFGKNTLMTIDDHNSAEVKDFNKGDLVIIKAVEYDQVKTGDVLYYYDVLNNTYILKKGEVKEKQGNSTSSIYMMKDGSSISQDRMIGKYENHKYRNMGTILHILSSRFGFLLIVILPIFMLFIYQVYKMIMLLKNNEAK